MAVSLESRFVLSSFIDICIFVLVCVKATVLLKVYIYFDSLYAHFKTLLCLSLDITNGEAAERLR